MENYLNSIKPYNVSSHDIWEMNEIEKKKCMKLDWNEASVPPSPKVCNRLKELVSNGDFYQWYPNTNNTKLILGISKYINVDQERVQVFASSDVLQEYIVRCWLRNGDRVLIVWPTYDNFRATAEFAGTEIAYSLMKDFKVSAELIQKDIDDKRPKMVYICNPNNPTGMQTNRDIIEQIVKMNNTVLFLIDEAYAEFSGDTVVDLTEKYENLLVSRTFSKAFALANFRIGYLVSCKKNIEIISKVRNAKSITTFSQEAAIAALEDVEYMQKYVRNVKMAREIFLEKMKVNSKKSNIYIYPSVANFLLVKLESEEMKRKFIHFMRDNYIYIRDLQQNVLSERYVRITVGTMEQMEIVADKINKFEGLYHESGSI